MRSTVSSRRRCSLQHRWLLLAEACWRPGFERSASSGSSVRTRGIRNSKRTSSAGLTDAGCRPFILVGRCVCSIGLGVLMRRPRTLALGHTCRPILRSTTEFSNCVSGSSLPTDPAPLCARGTGRRGEMGHGIGVASRIPNWVHWCTLAPRRRRIDPILTRDKQVDCCHAGCDTKTSFNSPTSSVGSDSVGVGRAAPATP